MKKLLYRFREGLFLLAAVLALIVIAPAPIKLFALTVDQTRIFNARQPTDQQIAYYRATINFNDQNIGAAQQFGALPSGAYIMSIDAYVTTAFNAGTTNAITLGTTKANSNEIVASGISGNPLATGPLHLTSAAGLGMAVTNVATPIPLFAKYAQTGTAATTGSITIVITYVSNNDN